MSRPVDVSALRAEVDQRGPMAYLVTVGPAGPHVVSVQVAWEDGVLTTGAGRTTAANVAVRPAVTLLWAARPGEDHCLLVDGTASLVGDHLAVEPLKAMQHREAGDDSGPRCVPVG
jgi:hypothetical protein